MASIKTETTKRGDTVKASADARFNLTDARKTLYAYLGAADFAVEKLRALPSQVGALRGQTKDLPQVLRTSLSEIGGRVNGTYTDLSGRVNEAYAGFAQRGEKVAASIRRDPATKEAIGQAKTAKSQVKAAKTSVTKAAGDAGGAVGSASGKIG